MHRQGLQLNPGVRPHPQGKSLMTCSYLILGFPVDSDLNTIQGGVRELGILESQIYSIEKSHWPYLFFLVFPQCLEFHMSDKYVEKEAPVELTASKTETVEKTPKINETVPVTPSPGELTGNAEADLKRCDELIGLAKKKCRRKIFDSYE